MESFTKNGRFASFQRYLWRYQRYLWRRYFRISWKGLGRGPNTLKPKVFGTLRTCKYMFQYLEIFQLRLEIQYSLVGDSLCTYLQFRGTWSGQISSRPHTTKKTQNVAEVSRNLLISGKSRLVTYYDLARHDQSPLLQCEYIHCTWPA